jgi:predicted alpha/beta superfamily hydrolase
MKNNILIFVLLFSLSSFAQIPIFNEPQPFKLGEYFYIDSKELNEKRTINVYFPQGYSKDSANTYPVVYVLDGSAHEDFIHIAGLAQFLNMYQLMPNSIVVGISNIDRKRDYTFPTTIEQDKKDFPTTGGSAKFIAFIENELQPAIKNSYNVNESKTIIGQSLGGLLATEILLKKPNLFNNYIIISPSLWWDNESLLKQAPELLKNSTDKKLNVFVGVGKEGKVMENDAKKLAALLKAQKNLSTHFEYLPNEDHATILHRAVYRAMEVFYGKK